MNYSNAAGEFGVFDVNTHLEILRDMDDRQCRLTLASLVGQDPAAFEKAVLTAAQYIYPVEG